MEKDVFFSALPTSSRHTFFFHPKESVLGRVLSYTHTMAAIIPKKSPAHWLYKKGGDGNSSATGNKYAAAAPPKKGPKYKQKKLTARDFLLVQSGTAPDKPVPHQQERPQKKKKIKANSEEIRRAHIAAAAAVVKESEGVPLIIVYTDGGCLDNGQPHGLAGAGVYFGPNDVRNLSERVPLRQTNQRAELYAAMRALQTIPLDTSVHIFTDSKYTIGCATEWSAKWEARNTWDSCKNVDLVKQILVEMRRRAHPYRVTMSYSNAHCGIPGNEGADDLATEGRTKSVSATQPIL